MSAFMEVLEELKNYVRKEEFAPVKSLVYGMVTLLLTAVFGAIISLVIRK